MNLRKITKDVCSKGHRIHVSRNVIDGLAGMTTPQINTIIAIVDALSLSLQYKAPFLFDSAGTDLTIPIPYTVIGGKHDPEQLVASISGLMSRQINYAYRVPGVNLEVITTFVSAIIRINGNIVVTVPYATLPYYLYCGQTVGFGVAERNILLQLHSAKQKILYLRLMAQVDRQTGMGTLRLSTEEMRGILGLPEDYPTKDIVTKIVRPFVKKMENFDSIGTVSFSTVFHNSGSKGRPTISGFSITATRHASSANGKNGESQPSLEMRTTLNILSRAIQETKKAQMTSTQVLAALEEKQTVGFFLDKMNRVIQNCRDKNKMINWRKVANYMSKILAEDYQIDIFAPKREC